MSIALVPAFKTYLREVGYRSSTVAMLPACVAEFLGHVDSLELDAIMPDDISAFYEWLKKRPHKRTGSPLSTIYIGHHLYALRVFFGWLEATEVIACNPMSTLRFPRPVVQPRMPLSRQEVEALFAACSTSEETALLHLFYSCGLRRSEAVQLNAADAHLGRHLLYIRQGKGQKRRAVPLPKQVAKDLRAYREEVCQHPRATHSEAFMLNTRYARMRGNSYYLRLQQLVQRAGLERSVSLHHLRHSIATHLLESGLPLEKLRDFLGHAHLESTQVYAQVSPHLIQQLISPQLTNG